MQHPMHKAAVVFDFDGTLISGGLDKAINQMIATWMAMWETRFSRLLHPDSVPTDVDRMIDAYANYPGAPRFQQLSATVNAVTNDRPFHVNEPAELGVEVDVLRDYEQLKSIFNDTYSALNDQSAKDYWRPFPAVPETLRQLSRQHDLDVASGVVQSILDRDIDTHGIPRSRFVAIMGSDSEGNVDKARLISRVRARGYSDVLFVGDSTKDLWYAAQADVSFHRIVDNDSFGELLKLAASRPFPPRPEPWSVRDDTLSFWRRKIIPPLERLVAGRPMSLEEISRFIHDDE